MFPRIEKQSRAKKVSRVLRDRSPVTDAERKLLEDTARTVLRLSSDVSKRLAAVEMVLLALYRANGNSELALARLRIERDLEKVKGRDTSYLTNFIEKMEAVKKAPPTDQS